MKPLDRQQLRTSGGRRSFLFKLFFVILAFSSFLVLSLSTIFYFSFQSTGIRIVQDSNTRILSQLSYNATYMDRTGKAYASALFNSGNSMALMFAGDKDPLEINRILTPLDETLNGMPFADSVYFFNRKSNLYYAIGPNKGIYPSGVFFDIEVKSIVESERNSSFRPIARKMPKNIYTPETTIRVYSYVFTDNSYISGGRIDAAVILNISADWLSDTIRSLQSRQSGIEGDVIVVNREGIVMADGTGKLFLRDDSEEEAVRRVLSSGKESGSFVLMVDGKRNIVTFATSEIPDWYYIVTTPVSTLLRPLYGIQVSTLAVLIIALVFAFLISLRLSRQLYRPVLSLQSDIDEVFGLPRHGQDVRMASDEFHRISDIIRDAGVRIDRLEEFKDASTDVLKSAFLRGFLRGDPHDRLSLIEDMERYLPTIVAGSGYRLVILRFDDFGLFHSSTDDHQRMLAGTAVREMAEQLFTSEEPGLSVDMEIDHIAMVIAMRSRSDTIDNASDALSVRCVVLQKQVSEILGISLTISISRETSEYSYLPTLYREALEATNLRLKLGKRNIITSSIAARIEEKEFALPIPKVKNLLDALKLNRFPEVLDIYRSFIGSILNYPHQDIRSILVLLFSSIYGVLIDMESNSGLRFNIDFPSFCNRINTLDTLDEIDQEFISLFQHCGDILESNRSSRTESLVRRVEDYIAQHFTDPNLSQTSISDAFHISHDHLGRVFREARMKSVSESINAYRIEKAKELLTGTSLTVDEIIGRVGVENRKYFFPLFKKSVGATPTEFRERHRKG